MSLRNLSCISSSLLKSFLDSFDNVLCDCDGVIYVGSKSVPGVKESLSKLRECGKQIRFVSNNSSYGLAVFHKRLQQYEVGAQKDDIVYPNLAIINYLKKIQFNKEIFVLGSTLQKKEFSDAGFVVANSGPDKLEESYEALLKTLQDDKDVGAVVFDFDLNLNYARLLKISVYLKRPDVLFITGATDKIIPMGQDTLLIGPKHFQETLEQLSGRSPLPFGKPALNLNKYITEKFNIQDASRTLFIGDSLEQDIEFATKCGYQKLLTLTGITNLEQAERCNNEDRIPDFYINSLGDLHELIKNKLNI